MGMLSVVAHPRYISLLLFVLVLVTSTTKKGVHGLRQREYHQHHHNSHHPSEEQTVKPSSFRWSSTGSLGHQYQAQLLLQEQQQQKQQQQNKGNKATHRNDKTRFKTPEEKVSVSAPRGGGGSFLGKNNRWNNNNPKKWSSTGMSGLTLSQTTTEAILNTSEDIVTSAAMEKDIKMARDSVFNMPIKEVTVFYESS